MSRYRLAATVALTVAMFCANFAIDDATANWGQFAKVLVMLTAVTIPYWTALVLVWWRNTSLEA